MKTRDMTRREFHAALKRRGWRQELVWIWGPKDAAGHPIGVGMVMLKTVRGWKTNYRASLAEAIKREGKP